MFKNLTSYFVLRAIDGLRYRTNALRDASLDDRSFAQQLKIILW